MTPAGLAAAGRDVTVPFRCRLQQADDGHDVDLTCVTLLRLLPGRRVVARAEVDGHAVLLKLFLGRGAARYAQREWRGCRRLAALEVPTPAVLARLQAPATDHNTPAHALLLEYLHDAVPAHPEDLSAVRDAALWLARLHDAGYRHRDLHLDNILTVPGGQCWLIDGDPVRRARWPGRVGRRPGLRNLAILCAQRPPLADADLDVVYAAYAGQRGWTGADRGAGVEALRRATQRQRSRRLRRYLRKSLRSCTEFRVERSWRHFLTALRSAWDDDLATFATDPEAAFSGAQVLKAGNSATVVRARIGERTLIVKRYNTKGLWHALRRALKPAARFRRAWLNGQRLWLLGIPTARPLLLLERRFGPLRGVAYLVMEDLGDGDLATEVDQQGMSASRLGQLVDLFRALRGAGLSHGDTKATNLLVIPAGLAVIDLDAMVESAAGQGRDVRRLLANFDGRPEVRRQIAEAFAAAGLSPDR
jgi:tRNA A-37 threonylcarbamoyl transferase component Bud32